MPKMRDQELKSILQAERQDALASMQSSDLTDQRTKALDYYNGDVSTDMPALEGRSKAVSNDVRDTVEGLMPSLMDIFAGSDDVVRFDPQGPEDVEAAQQETDYCNYVFMQQNAGFLVLYQMIKDALLSKTGICKVWWETKETQSRETYYDLPEDAYALVQSDPDLEIVEHTPKEGMFGMLHDITLKVKKNDSKCCVEPVPPEEFGISRRARVNLQDTGYCFHEVVKPLSDLTDMGYDYDQISKLGSYAGDSYKNADERWARDTVNESSLAGGDTDVNKAMRPIRVTEHYLKMDYDGDGVARRYKVTTGGEDSDILLLDGKPDIEEVEWWPFASLSPIINPHRFIGLSMADVVMDIQRIKTAITRGLLDNIYFAINPRPVVSEAEATPETLDDIMRWRQGDPIRVKANANTAIAWQSVPDITGTIYPALQYFDAVREWRSGVSRQGQGLDADALNNQTATAAQQLYNASQARMKLIARIFAETGITDMFWLIHSTVRKYGDQTATVRLRNNWVTVDPRQWKSRADMTINVGLGHGGQAEQVTGIMGIISLQKAALEGGLGMLVNPKQLYNSAAEYCKAIKIKDVERYFSDPGENAEMPPPAPDPKIMQMQAQAEIEKVQAEADIATQDRKAQSDIAIKQQEFEMKRELAMLDHNLKMEESKHKRLTDAVTTAAKAGAGDSEVGGGGNGVAQVVQDLLDELRKSNAPKRERVRKVRNQDGSTEWIKEPLQ